MRSFTEKTTKENQHGHESLRELAGTVEHPLSKKFPLGVADREKLR